VVEVDLAEYRAVTDLLHAVHRTEVAEHLVAVMAQMDLVAVVVALL
jgi:hypothetical protein